MAALDFTANLEKGTWVHNLDPRAKFFMILSFVFMPLIYMDPLYLTGILVLGLPLWFSAKLEIRPIMGLFATILILAMTAIVFATFYNYNIPEAVTLFRIGPLKATDIGFYSGLVFAYRIAIPCFMSIILIATTDPAMLAKAMMKMKVPMSIAFMLLGSLRFFPLVFEEMNNIVNAQTIRGVKKNGMKNQWNAFKLATFPLMINSLRRSRTMGLAVESKGFGKKAWKEYYQELKLDRTDYIVIVATIVFIIAAVYVRFGLGLGWNPLFRAA